MSKLMRLSCTEVLLLCLLELFHLGQFHLICPSGCHCTPNLNHQSLLLHLHCSNIPLHDNTTLYNPLSLHYDHVPTEKIIENYLIPLNATQSNLTSIEWRNSGIKQISESAFSKIVNLKHLDLGNNEIVDLDEALRPLKNLLILNLTANHLNPAQNVFSSLNNITELYLGANNLKSHHLNYIKHLRNLVKLDLSYNHITEISSETFTQLVNIKVLIISGNNLRSIGLPFKKLTNLTYLDLSSNSLSSIDDNIFETLFSLEYLDISDNNIEDVSKDFLAKLTNLIYLKLSKNPIKNLPSFVFAHCLHLETIIMEKTNIKHINGDIFYGLFNLSTLIMRDNRLSDIANYTFYRTQKLHYLDLSGNDISQLSISVKYLPKLNSLLLNGNPLECDCTMMWYLDWLEKIHNEENICLEKNSNFSVTNFEKMDCGKRHNESLPYIVELGSPVLLTCGHIGSMPFVSWILPSELNLTIRLSKDNNTELNNRIKLLNNGSLYISKVLRDDSGLYVCSSNDEGNHLNITSRLIVQIDPVTYYRMKIFSILAGIMSALTFLIVTVIVQSIKIIVKRCCCGGREEDSSKRKQMFQVLESIEQYKTHQLEKLRENYTQQVSPSKNIVRPSLHV